MSGTLRGSRHALAALFVVFTIVQPLLAHVEQYTAVLTGPNESPPNASPGIGSALITLDLDLVTMRVEASFSGLLGTTTICHIHGLTTVPLAGTAGVATQQPTFPGFPAGVTAGVYDMTFDMTLASSYNPAFITASGGTVSDALNAMINGLAQGRMYFNVHSSAFGGGEIRGFLVPVPEPSSAGLLGAALMLACRRTRKRV